LLRKSYIHVVDAEFFVLVPSAAVHLDVNLRVVSRRVRVVDEAVGKWVVQNHSEGLLASLQHLEAIDELQELEVGVGVAAAEGVGVAQMRGDVVQEAFHSRVHAAKRAGLELKLDLGDLEAASFRLEYISVQILSSLHIKHDLSGLIGDATTLLDLS